MTSFTFLSLLFRLTHTVSVKSNKQSSAESKQSINKTFSFFYLRTADLEK